MQTVVVRLLIGLLIVFGCAMKVLPAEHYTVSGRLHYAENFPLPSDAIATLTLTDVSPLQDSSATLIARQVMYPPHLLSSVPFVLTVAAADISDHHLYAIQARVASGGRVILTNDPGYPVITQGNPTAVEIYVTSTPSPQADPLVSGQD